MPELVNNVLKGNVAKTASAKRGQEVIVKARCLDCHKFGDKGAGLGPDLTTLNSRFQPADILESIVLPSKVISDQYKSITVATQDGKLYNGMPIVADGPSLVLLAARRHQGDRPQVGDRRAESVGHIGDARGIAQPAQPPGDRRPHGSIQLDAARGRPGSRCRQRQVIGSSRVHGVAPALVVCRHAGIG